MEPVGLWLIFLDCCWEFESERLALLFYFFSGIFKVGNEVILLLKFWNVKGVKIWRLLWLDTIRHCLVHSLELLRSVAYGWLLAIHCIAVCGDIIQSGVRLVVTAFLEGSSACLLSLFGDIRFRWFFLFCSINLVVVTPLKVTCVRLIAPQVVLKRDSWVYCYRLTFKRSKSAVVRNHIRVTTRTVSVIELGARKINSRGKIGRKWLSVYFWQKMAGTVEILLNFVVFQLEKRGF